MRHADTILYIEHYAGSPVHGMEFRPYYLAKRWVRMGFRVIIVAASFAHVRKTNPKVSATVTKEVLDGITYLWLKTPTYAGAGLGRVINMVVFVYRVLRLHRRLASLPAVRAVIASSTYPLDIYPAYLIARRARARLIFEVHDLWPLSPMELGGYSRYHPFILVMQCSENFAYRKSHHVVSILPKTLPHMIRHGLAAEKFTYIPNGIDPEEIGRQPSEETAALQQIPAGKFIVGYTGSLGIANSLECFVEAAAALREVQEIRFIIVGAGPEKGRLARMASERRVTNLDFLPPVSKNQVIAVMKRFDVCYLGLKRSKLYRFGISPNKLFDYMYAGRPILQAIEAGNDLVADTGCGISVEPDNPAAVTEAVMRFYRMTPQMRSAMGEKGRQFVLANHSYDRLAERFSALFGDGDCDTRT
jgi:glycosyltransferase involved in cell wall biosynthesis